MHILQPPSGRSSVMRFGCIGPASVRRGLHGAGSLGPGCPLGAVEGSVLDARARAASAGAPLRRAFVPVRGDDSYDPAYHARKMSPPITIPIAAMATGVRIELVLGFVSGSGGRSHCDMASTYTPAVAAVACPAARPERHSEVVIGRVVIGRRF
jgi:hypothetical protein